MQPSLRFTLSFIEGNGVLQLEDRPLGVGGLAERLALDIPGLRFPFDLSGGLARFQNRHSRLRELVLAFTPAEIAQMVQRAPLARFGIVDPIVEVVADGVRLAARAVVGGREADFTARGRVQVAPLGRLAVTFDDIRVYGFLPLPAPLLTGAVFAALGARAVGPLTAPGPTRLELAILELSLFPLLAAQGWRMPERREVGFLSADVGPGGVQLHLLRQAAEQPPGTTSPAGPGPLADADAALASGDFRFAWTAYRQAHARDPDDLLARQRLLQLLASGAEHLPELEGMAETMALTTPDLPAVLLAQAQAAAERGEPARAARHYLRAAELAEAADEILDLVCAWRAAAAQQLRAGQHAAATGALERALARRPDHLGVMGDLRQRLSAEERWEELLQLLWQQAAAQPDLAARAALLSAGGMVLLERLGKPELARERFEQALHQFSEDPGAREGLGRLKAGQGDRPAALVSLEQAARLYGQAGQLPGQARVEVALGRLEEGAGSDERALPRYRRAAELDPQAIEPVLAAADLLRKLGRPAEVADLLQGALARVKEPHARVQIHRRLAALDQEQRSTLAARQHLEDALRERAADLGALEDLARLLESEGQGERLESFLRRAAGAASGAERGGVGRLCETWGRQHGKPALLAEGLFLLAMQGGLAGAERALALADLAEHLDSGALLRRAADAIESVLAGETGDPLPVARLANRLATLRLRQGDRTASEKLAHQALESFPDADGAAEAWRTIVRCALERGDVAAMKVGLAGWAEDARVADDPRARAARLAEAAALERDRLGSAAEAAPLFERALALDPTSQAALAGLADAAQENEQWPRLEELLRRMCGAQAGPPPPRELRHRLAEALLRRGGRAEEAAGIYEGLQEQDPADARAALGVGRALWQVGRLEESVARLEKALGAPELAESAPEGVAEANLRLAQAARLFGEVDRASRHLELALKDEPRRGAPADVLVEVLEAFDQIDDLVGLLERRRAHAADAPRARAAVRALGGVLERAGRGQDAVALYRELLQEAPDDLEALSRLAEIFRRESRRQELVEPLGRLFQLAASGTDNLDLEAIGLELVELLEETGASPDRVEPVRQRIASRLS
jgi:tetratricopeptide (TPR) repeat protein